MANIWRLTTIHTHIHTSAQFKVPGFRIPQVHVFGLWEEVGEARGNCTPTHGEHANYSQKSLYPQGIWTQNLWGTTSYREFQNQIKKKNPHWFTRACEEKFEQTVRLSEAGDRAVLTRSLPLLLWKWALWMGVGNGKKSTKAKDEMKQRLTQTRCGAVLFYTSIH